MTGTSGGEPRSGVRRLWRHLGPAFGKVRAKVKHVFRVMRCQFDYRKVRHRGIGKNGAQVFSLLALANLYLGRMEPRRPVTIPFTQGIKSRYSEVPL